MIEDRRWNIALAILNPPSSIFALKRRNLPPSFPKKRDGRLNGMEPNRICPNCRKPLPADVPLGLCPECLIKSGFPTGTDPGAAAGARFVPPPIDEVRLLFPQLEILGFIGKGGMGAVYQARQPALNRFVALKVLPPATGSDPGFAERFNREARALAQLNHPNIVAVHDFGKAGPLHYLVMEFVDGTNLREVEHAGRLSPEQALAIVPQICAALQFAHDEGVVHRDIKPENILLDKRGRVKITDFGIAKIMGLESGPAALTGARDVIGTPHYMAPEQVEKPRTVDHRADIYSLGVVFYEMLTGELPLGKFQPPSHKVQIDVRLDEVVLHALAKEPERRYQQASQVKTAVETIATTPPASGGPAPTLESPLKVSLGCVSTPEHLHTFLGGTFYHCLAKGELRLDKETLSFNSGWSVVKIPLSSVRALSIGAFPVSFLTPIRMLYNPYNYLAVTYTDGGASRMLLFTPTPPLDTIGDRVRYGLTDPRKKFHEHLLVLNEWLRSLREAIQARTGDRLPLSQPPAENIPSMWKQWLWLLFCVVFIALLGKRPLLDILSVYWPDPIAAALAPVNALPGSARAAVSFAISILDAGLFLFLILLLTHLLTRLAAVAGPLSHKLSVQYANSFPPQTFDENSWLSVVDSGKYAESWSMASHTFQCAIRQEEWVARLEKVRRPLGKVVTRKLRSIKGPRSLTDAAVGTRLEQKFSTSFVGLPAAVETLTCAKQLDASWRIIGYRIHPADPLPAYVAFYIPCLSGILGIVTFFCRPSPPQILVWSILVPAVIGVGLGILTRRTRTGKKALFSGSLAALVWLAIFLMFQALNSPYLKLHLRELPHLQQSPVSVVSQTIQHEVGRQLREAGATYDDLQVAVAVKQRNGTPFKVAYRGLQNFKGADGVIPDADGEFMMTYIGGGQWRGALAGTVFTVTVGSRDNLDLPFVNDPQVLGAWQCVDFVVDPSDFNPDKPRWPADKLGIKSLTFLPDGKMPQSWMTWTKGKVLHHGDRTASNYEIKEIKGHDYLFFEWKSGDVSISGMKPCYYVLHRDTSGTNAASLPDTIERQLHLAGYDWTSLEIEQQDSSRAVARLTGLKPPGGPDDTGPARSLNGSLNLTALDDGSWLVQGKGQLSYLQLTTAPPKLQITGKPRR
jgi:serine/threonine protein kinase